MSFRTSSRSLLVRVLILAGTASIATATAHGQTWSGAGADNNWTNASNWTGGAPLNNGTANVIFAGTTRLTPAVNVAYDVNSITFNNTAGAFTIGGVNALTIRGGGITNNDTQGQVFGGGAIVVAAPQTWNAAAGILGFANAGVTLNANLTINATANVQTATPFSGAGDLIKNGGGNMTVFTSVPASTNTGVTNINQGAVILSGSNVLSDSSPVTIGATGLLNLGGGSDTIPRLTGAAGAQVLLGSSTLTLSSASGSATYSGSISGAGNVVKSGSYVQTFGGVNTYTGTTTVSAGTLQLAASERLADASDLIINGSGEVDIAAFTETVDQFVITGGFLTGSGVLAANNFDVQGGIISVALAGPGSLNKSNNASNAIMNDSGSTYTGDTNITGGILLTNDFDVLPDTTVVNVTTPGVLQVTNFPDTIRGITGNGTINILDTTLTINDAGSSFTFNGAISDLAGPNPGSLAKSGTGTLTINGPCTYAGTTTVNGGILALGAPERLANNSDVVVNQGLFIVLDETIDACTLNGGEIRATSLNNGTLRANQYSLNAGFVDASLAGPGAIIKSTAGIVTLAAANSPLFTRVDAGILIARSDAVFGPDSVSVSLNGGTLSLIAPTTINRPVYVFTSSTIDCAADVTLANFSPAALAGPLTKTGLGTLTITGLVGSLAALNVNAGAVSLPATNYAGASISVAAPATLELDGSLVSLTSSFTNAGTLDLRNDARLSCGSLSNSGVISGSGRILAALTNLSPGDIRIAAGDSLHFTATSSAINSGLLEVIGGTVEFDGPVSNSISTGLVFARNATLRFDGNLTNAGSLAFSFGVSDVFGDVTNTGSGSIVVSGLANVTFVGDVVNNGAIRTSAGAASVFFGAVSGAGSFPGTGTVFLEGDLRPGNSPAEVEFEGDLVLGLFAHTQIELGGTGPGQSDRVIVGRDASIDGDLTVSLINGFRPSGSFVYPLLIAGDSGAGARFGEFFRVNLPPDVRGMRVRYTPTRVELVYCQSDFNSDGFVNSQDFFDFLTVFVTTPPGSGADFNADGFVNSQDFFDFLTALFNGC